MPVAGSTERGASPLSDATVDSGGLERSAVLELLRDGEITVEGRLVDASNATLYCNIELGDRQGRCVYKPVLGERPLWDFPDGTLAGREVAAFLVSEAMSQPARRPPDESAEPAPIAAIPVVRPAPGAPGARVGCPPADGSDVGIVPPTVLREGPFGTGMAQLWIDVDVTVDLVTLTRSDDPRLRRIALFDAVINNADRKGGHLLPGPSGRVYGIDHGISFHAENKLRTLLWTWRGKRLSPADLALLGALRAELDDRLGDDLHALLTRAEVRALARRVDHLVTTGRFPQPSGEWPAIPWPPF
ncbi:MAG: SCO1664 family protein [Frankia sp.]